MEKAIGSFRVTGPVIVVIPDATRPIDYALVLPPLLRRMPNASMTVLVALGLHRPMTAAELQPLLALKEDFGFELVQHDADSPRPFGSNETIVTVGVVEPHQYAGFSGGAKTIAIGCGSRAFIREMHGLSLLQRLENVVGSEGPNPFADRLWEAVADLDPYHLLIVPGDSIVFGKGRAIHQIACSLAAEQHFQEVDPVPWMHLVVPASKSQSFYQASRAATYAALVDRPATDGWLLVDAACPEGLGLGAGELAFAEALTKGSEQLLRELNQDEPPETSGGAQRAYVLAQAMEQAQIALIRETPIAELEAFGIPCFSSFDEAQRKLGLQAGGIVVTDPIHKIPRRRLPTQTGSP